MGEYVREVRVPDEGWRKKRPLLIDVAIRLVREKPLGTIGGVIVVILFLTGLFADLTWLGFPSVGDGGPGLMPYGYNEQELGARLEGPSASHWLGADNLGRDMLSRIIYGARISMYVGMGAASIGVVLSTMLGVISGYFGGKVDIIIQRFVDAWMCFPPLFIILTIMAVLGPGLAQVIIVMGLIYGIARSRIIRSAVISIKQNVYIDAARAIGAPTGRILWRHILPNVFAPIIVLFTMDLGAAIILEATLSFLGFGIPPPTPSWGGMLSKDGRRYMLYAPHMALWPGLVLATVVFGINMLGDALRDLLDPRMRGGLGRFGGVKAKKAKQYQSEG